MGVLVSLFPRLLPLFVFMCNVGIFLYILEIEKEDCECSRNWKRDFAKYFSVVVMIFCLLVILFKDQLKSVAFALVLRLYSLVAFAYAVIVLVYFTQLVVNKCECSKDWKRALLLYPVLSIPFAIIVSVVFLMVLGKKDFVAMVKKSKN